MAKTIKHLGEPYYEINDPQPLKLSKINYPEAEEVIQFVSSQIYESTGVAFDSAIRDAFELYGIDRWTVQRLLNSGRLKLLTGGFIPQLTAFATLDGEDLFVIKTNERFDSERNVWVVDINFTPLKKLEESDNE